MGLLDKLVVLRCSGTVIEIDGAVCSGTVTNWWC